MIKWLLTVVVALFLLSALRPVLQRIGIGRLPGDFRVTIKGRTYEIPLASTVLLTLLATALARVW
ncbi:MAG: DUF2905 domain-containing protein [Burkholderiaceae bacterium]|jgi:Protein of unknown function (DUF2905)